MRSRVSNGHLPAGINGNSAAGRRFTDIVGDLSAELGGDLSAAEQLQARTIATLTLQLEHMQAEVLAGLPTDPDQLARVANAIARGLNALKRSRSARKPANGREALQAHLDRKREGVA